MTTWTAGRAFLVTGGAGFIGSHLVDALLRGGARVRVLDDFSTGSRRNLELAAGDRGDTLEVYEGDIRRPDDCDRACVGIDYVLHHAALGSVHLSVEDPRTTHAVNATGTLNVLEAARIAGVARVVFASSCALYGDTDEAAVSEARVLAPQSPYAVTKLVGEQYAAVYQALYDLPVACLRYFNVFGPRQDPASLYAAVVPRFFTALLGGRRATIYGDGEQTRDFVYVDDVVQANLLACQAAPAPLAQGPINIGGGASVSVNALYEHIAGIVGTGERPDREPARAGEVRHSLADITRAGEVLGFTPSVSVAEGLARSAGWYRNGGAA